MRSLCCIVRVKGAVLCENSVRQFVAGIVFCRNSCSSSVHSVQKGCWFLPEHDVACPLQWTYRERLKVLGWVQCRGVGCVVTWRQTLLTSEYFTCMLSIEMCAGRNLLEREGKETRSRLKKIFLFPVFFRFFCFLERVFPLFPIFLWIINPVFRRSFPVFSSFHLSKPVPCF